MSNGISMFTEGDDAVTLTNIICDLKAKAGDDRIVVKDNNYTFFIFGEAGRDTMIGGEGNDRFFGGDDGDHLIGGKGNDLLSGDEGDDLIEGGDGLDALFGGDSSTRTSPRIGGESYEYDYIDGSDIRKLTGGDTLFGGAGNDEIIGFDGTDHLYGGDQNDDVYGGADDDLLDGGGGHDELYGGSGNDTIYGGAGSDTLIGGDGDDALYSGDGIDDLDGGDGNDTLYADREDFQSDLSFSGDLDGGDGHDLLSLRFVAEGPANASGFEIAMVDFQDFEAVEGSDFNDTLQSRDTDVAGGAGDDLIISNGGGQNLQGGDGFDEVTYRSSTTGVSVALDSGQLGWATNGRGGNADGDLISGIESVDGSNFVDVLYGDGYNNSLRGRQENDSLFGGEGADTLLGNQGDDLLEGGAGADTLDGGGGNDTATYRDSKAGVYVHLNSPTQGGHGLRGDAAFDKLINIENLIGSYHDDHLRADDGDNRLEGSFGDDTLEGFAGDDTLIGAQGDDTLTGGKGADVFVFNADYHTGNDTITDFEEGVDRIEIYGEAEAEIIQEDWGAMVVIQGPEQLTLTIKDAWELDLTFMG